MNRLLQLRSDLQRRVQAATGTQAPSLLASVLTPAIYLLPGEENGAGSHRGGGPHGVQDWPVWEGSPLVFLLAVRLSEVQMFDLDEVLPTRGWLNVFVAREVLSGGASPEACAVVVTPDEEVCEVEPLEGAGACERQAFDFALGFHSVPQDYEFARLEEAIRAGDEAEALGYEVLPEEIEAVQDEDYLLGKQLYSTAMGLEHVHDLRTLVRGQEDTRLRALLTLRVSGAWPFFEGNSLLALTFFIPPGDLRAGRFDRVLVDFTVD